MLENAIFDKFAKLPQDIDRSSQVQFSVSVGYKPGQITQRYRGKEPDWWDAFATAVFNYISMIYTEGRKSADSNIGPVNQ